MEHASYSRLHLFLKLGLAQFPQKNLIMHNGMYLASSFREYAHMPTMMNTTKNNIEYKT
jgi:hypothetical protein